MFHQTTLTASLVFTLGAALALPAQAGELRRDQLPADIDWVLHVDMQAVIASDLYQQAEAAGLLARMDTSGGRNELFGELELEFEGSGDFERVLLMHDFDPFEDFKSLTLFGTLEDTDEAVVLFEFGGKAPSILADLRAQPEHIAIEHAGLMFDAWLEDGNEINGYLFALPPAEDGSMWIAVCEEREPLLSAARVLMGEQSSLASVTESGEHGLRAKSGKGSFVYIEVAGPLPGIGAGDPTSRVLSSARSLRLDVGEQDGLFLAQLSLQTDQAEEARRVAQVIQGVIALGSLAAANNPESRVLSELADGVSVAARDTELIADFEIESNRMVQLASEYRERRRAKRAEFRKHHEERKR